MRSWRARFVWFSDSGQHAFSVTGGRVTLSGFATVVGNSHGQCAAVLRDAVTKPVAGWQAVVSDPPLTELGRRVVLFAFGPSEVGFCFGLKSDTKLAIELNFIRE